MDPVVVVAAAAAFAFVLFVAGVFFAAAPWHHFLSLHQHI